MKGGIMRIVFGSLALAFALCVGCCPCKDKCPCPKTAPAAVQTGCCKDCHCKEGGKCCCDGTCKPTCTCTDCSCKKAESTCPSGK